MGRLLTQILVKEVCMRNFTVDIYLLIFRAKQPANYILQSCKRHTDLPISPSIFKHVSFADHQLEPHNIFKDVLDARKL